jgi:hypothetical protein
MDKSLLMEAELRELVLRAERRWVGRNRCCTASGSCPRVAGVDSVCSQYDLNANDYQQNRKSFDNIIAPAA